MWHVEFRGFKPKVLGSQRFRGGEGTEMLRKQDLRVPHSHGKCWKSVASQHFMKQNPLVLLSCIGPPVATERLTCHQGTEFLMWLHYKPFTS